MLDCSNASSGGGSQVAPALTSRSGRDTGVSPSRLLPPIFALLPFDRLRWRMRHIAIVDPLRQERSVEQTKWKSQGASSGQGCSRALGRCRTAVSTRNFDCPRWRHLCIPCHLCLKLRRKTVCGSDRRLVSFSSRPSTASFFALLLEACSVPVRTCSGRPTHPPAQSLLFPTH